MKYFLDTNICVYFLKGKYPSIGEKMRTLPPSQIKIPSIVKAELLYGAAKSNQPKRSRSVIDDFLFPFQIIPFDDACTFVYAKIRSSLEDLGKVIGPNDLIIAATVCANHGVLITNNIKEFGRIKELKLKNWTLY